jgi:hypothetical protein
VSHCGAPRSEATQEPGRVACFKKIEHPSPVDEIRDFTQDSGKREIDSDDAQ